MVWRWCAGRWRSQERVLTPTRPPAFPSVPGTGGRRRRGSPRSALAFRIQGVEGQLLLPDPEGPVMTTSWLRGRSQSTPFRLWTLAPRMEIGSSLSRLTGVWSKPQSSTPWQGPQRSVRSEPAGPRRSEAARSGGAPERVAAREHVQVDGLRVALVDGTRQPIECGVLLSSPHETGTPRPPRNRVPGAPRRPAAGPPRVRRLRALRLRAWIAPRPRGATGWPAARKPEGDPAPAPGVGASGRLWTATLLVAASPGSMWLHAMPARHGLTRQTRRQPQPR
jgi:hypothetical protein